MSAIKAFFKFLLIVLIWAIILAILIGGALLLERPIEQAVTVFAIIFGLWYGFKIIRWLWRRYQAKQRVKELVNVEPEAKGFRFRWRLGAESEELDGRLKQIINLLRRSELRKYGDPLYVQPWYLLLAPDAQGRDLLTESQLPRPTLNNDALLSEHGPDWHLLDDSVIVRVPEQYFSLRDAVSKPDWIRLLTLFSKRRPELPVNGLIISLPQQMIAGAENMQLMELANAYRRMYDDVIQLTGYRVPVTLLISDLQEIPGFEDWLKTLSPEQRQQTIGYTLEDQDDPLVAINTLFVRFESLFRKYALIRAQQRKIDPAVLNLIRNFDQLRENLRAFVGYFNKKNKYQIEPAIKGLYLYATYTQAGERRPVFTQDLFTRILPSFAGMVERQFDVKPEQFIMPRKQWAMAAGAAAVLVFLLNTLYERDKAFLEQALTTYDQAQLREVSDVERVNNVMQMMHLIETLQSTHYVPWLRPDQKPLFVEQMKAKFIHRLESTLLDSLDRQFAARLNEDLLNASSVDLSASVDYTTIIIRKINIIDGFLAGQSQASLAELPKPYDENVITRFPPTMLNELNTMYLQSLFWMAELDQEQMSNKLMMKREDLRNQLQSLLERNGESLSWVLKWAERNAVLKEYRLDDYWERGSRNLEKDIRVSGIYTLQGNDVITDFLDELSLALGPDDSFQRLREALFDTYYQQYVTAWRDFLVNFDQGSNKLSQRMEWLDVVNNLSTGRNAYFNVLNDADEHLALVIDKGYLNEWMDLLVFYQDMLALGADKIQDNTKRNTLLTKMALKFVGKAGPLGKALAKQGKTAMKTKKKLDKASASGPDADERALALDEAARLLDQYKQSIADLTYNAEIKSVSFENISAVFANPDNPAAGGTALAAAYETIRKLESMIGKENPNTQAFWEVFKGPARLISNYMAQEASCHIDESWREKILLELEGVPEYKRQEFLLGETGVIWQFVNEDLKNFVQRRLSAGYSPVKAAGYRVQFSNGFLTYLSKARDQVQAQRYSPLALTLHASPTSTNAEAVQWVKQTDVTLQCPDKVQTLSNLNFPNQASFDWNEACTETRIRLLIGDTELIYTYEGTDGFAQFVRDFEGGRRIFTQQDFPAQAYLLNALNISAIDVRMRVEGGHKLLSRAERQPTLAIPHHIASCWG